MNILFKLMMSVTLLECLTDGHMLFAEGGHPTAATETHDAAGPTESTVTYDVIDGLLGCLDELKLMALHQKSEDEVTRFCEMTVRKNEEKLRLFEAQNPCKTREDAQGFEDLLARVNSSITEDILHAIVPQHKGVMIYSTRAINVASSVAFFYSRFPDSYYFPAVYGVWGVSLDCVADLENLGPDALWRVGAAYNRFAADFNEYMDKHGGRSRIKLFDIGNLRLVNYNPVKLVTSPEWFGGTLSTKPLPVKLQH
ncbi:MAG: hypothetical protein LBQ43_04990 [Holosporales bacterium]|jgi:hypothetical protein|nr:hypothetical protein [Holosporales bacterium]